MSCTAFLLLTEVVRQQSPLTVYTPGSRGMAFKVSTIFEDLVAQLLLTTYTF
jgi:hypothetical protein